jgi:hypothetical protein
MEEGEGKERNMDTKSTFQFVSFAYVMASFRQGKKVQEQKRD